jgi:hypothetical protein
MITTDPHVTLLNLLVLVIFVALGFVALYLLCRVAAKLGIAE